MSSSEHALVSDEPTIELITRAKGGDGAATEALLQRCLPSLKRWAHGRLPMAARGAQDTEDIVQHVVVQMLKRLEHFEPRHVGAMQAYLRQAVVNRIRDEIKRRGRQPLLVELPEDQPGDKISPLEAAIQAQEYDRYREALMRLRRRDRELIVARIEAQWSLAEIADHFSFSTIDAARMAVLRAMRRLTATLARPGDAKPRITKDRRAPDAAGSGRRTSSRR